MPRVFISHATADWPFISREILPLLHQAGVETWHCEDDIHTADHWERSIYEGLKNSDWFLVVVSVNSCHSAWVRRELAWAEKRRAGRIVPVLIDASDPAELHLAIEEIQFVDFRGERQAAATKLLRIWQLTPTGQPSPPPSGVDLLAKDLEQAEELKAITAKANAGDRDAQYKLALALETGAAGRRDEAAAFEWYRRAAEQGLVDAQFDLGYCYQNAKGTTENPAEAVRWYLAAAEQGRAGAQTAAAWCHQKGYGTPTDYRAALSLYQQAAKQGDAHALYSIGYCYQFGVGVPTSLTSASRFYLDAHQSGHPKARTRLQECQAELRAATANADNSAVRSIVRPPRPVSGASINHPMPPYGTTPLPGPIVAPPRRPAPVSSQAPGPATRLPWRQPARPRFRRDLVLLVVGLALGIALVLLWQVLFRGE